METSLIKGELPDADACYKLAANWLESAFRDPDLATDTRVSVPVMADAVRHVTRLWLTLGVRLARLEASYARPPSIKEAKGNGKWQVVEPYRLGTATYLIPVDEYAELELPALKVLTRDELRQVCDREGSKENILQALRR
jgi:hypothetical protein